MNEKFGLVMHEFVSNIIIDHFHHQILMFDIKSFIIE